MELPKSTRFDMVMTVVKLVSNTAYFILTYIIVNAEEV